MNQEVIYQIVGYTLAVALLAYLFYRLYRTLTVLLLISLFVIGGITCYVIVNQTYLGYIVVGDTNLQPVIAVLFIGACVGLAAVPLFLIFNIRYLEIKVDRLRATEKADSEKSYKEKDVEMLMEKFKKKPREELLSILSEADTGKYRPAAFEAIRRIISESKDTALKSTED